MCNRQFDHGEHGVKVAEVGRESKVICAVMFHINLTSEPLIMCQSSLQCAVCHHLFHQ
jgi:hypothetical protein